MPGYLARALRPLRPMLHAPGVLHDLIANQVHRSQLMPALLGSPARLQPPRAPETAATRTVRVMLLSARECSTSSAVCSLSTVQHAPWVIDAV